LERRAEVLEDHPELETLVSIQEEIAIIHRSIFTCLDKLKTNPKDKDLRAELGALHLELVAKSKKRWEELKLLSQPSLERRLH